MRPAPPPALSDPNSVHAHVHIAGHTVSAQELAKEVEQARMALKVSRGDVEAGEEVIPGIVIKEEDLQTAKANLEEKVQSGNIGYPAEHIWYAGLNTYHAPLSAQTNSTSSDRILMGEGKLDFSASNGNELVNPAGRLWTWRTAADLVAEGGL